MGVEDHEATLTRAVEAWNRGDVDSYMELYSEDINLHSETYDFPDKAAVEGMYKGFHAAVPGVQLEIHETFGDGQKLAVRYTVTGTQTGELMGIPPTGGEISITGLTIMHFAGHKVAERWDSDDSAEVLSMLRSASPSTPG